MAANEYVFDEEWFIPAMAEDVWDVIANGKLLPEWWTGVYLEAEPLDDFTEPTVGARVKGKARGLLPYKLRFTIESTELTRPRVVAVKTKGDLTGTWQATLYQEDAGTRVKLRECVSADKPMLRALTPLLKPMFEWNHRWTTPRGQSGLIAYLGKKGKLNTTTARRETLRPDDFQDETLD